MEELLKIKEKYKISDKEMFVLSKLESNKANEGFIEKTKTSTMQEVILKKYRLSFFEKQKFLKNLKFSTFHTNEEFIEKYKDSELSVELQNEGKKGLKKGVFILGMVVFTFLGLLILFNFGESKNSIVSDKTDYVNLLYSDVETKDEALEIIKNSEWEEITELDELGVGNVSTFLYFDDKGFCYLYSTKPGDYKNEQEILGKFAYEIDFKNDDKGKIIQICINGCDNPNKYFLVDENNMNFIQFGESVEIKSVKRI